MRLAHRERGRDRARGAAVVTFAVLEADCPWRFGDKLPGNGRGAEKHYPCMSVADLCAFPLPPLAGDCALFFWRVAAMQREALDVIDAWGFTPKTEIVWQKTTKTGKKHFGMGRIVRASHEVCLVATRGRPVVMDRSVRSTFSAPVGRHSEKPPAFYDIVERLFDGPYVRLFARSQRPGWVSLGNELPEAA
jgi:N6-adenosine-specific RNA methylase IME4